ncbi:hypothetical protein V500_08201 [Pseudogymnoascus sp. VKM F-4518 (FW-2643)]|nr:hypothetical protein V500_08201 [Pseudogymnoascus sp. VKM F-4518 (FW-2643)]KFZ12435.1 hypothetical protein V502_07080 [Pseudogymnoascus sp. VKM F-4520 (FW-2644)]
MSSQDSPPPSRETIARQRSLLRYTSFGALVICPLLIALPPRKMDVYTVAALASTGLSGNYLVGDYTGRTIVDRAKFSAAGFMAERAEKKRLQERKTIGEVLGSAADSRPKEGWKVQRDEREKKAVEEGKGYGDLIMDQIWDVWTWGKGDK